MPRHLSPSCLALLLCPACFVPQDSRPQVDIGATFASKFVHRGMTMVARPVLQPRLDVALPTTVEDGTLLVRTFANMNLENGVGSAWFPQGHAGRFTQIEYIGAWEQKLGAFDVQTGIHSYNVPNGLEFPNGERGGTTEVFATVSANVLETKPFLSLHYDFDEVRSTYLRGGISEDFELADGLTLNVLGWLGYARAGQSAWMYGIDRTGLADLAGSIELGYVYDERTTFDCGLHGSLIVDSTIQDWFGQLGIDDSPWWVTLGVNWAF
ncbi:MAG: hypothetical protein KDE27_10630 [Planctomycetes bacterium]|nr:hypothetical protein [Planctomycetota bacterium]